MRIKSSLRRHMRLQGGGICSSSPAAADAVDARKAPAAVRAGGIDDDSPPDHLWDLLLHAKPADSVSPAAAAGPVDATTSGTTTAAHLAATTSRLTLASHDQKKLKVWNSLLSCFIFFFSRCSVSGIDHQVRFLIPSCTTTFVCSHHRKFSRISRYRRSTRSK